MYNAITTWVKNNLIDAFACKTESRQDWDFSRSLQEEYKNYNSIIVGENSSLKENIITMDVEICGKYIKTFEIISSDEEKGNVILTNEKGDRVTHFAAPEKRDIGVPNEAAKQLRKPQRKDYSYREFDKEYEEQLVQLGREQVADDSSETDIPLTFLSIGKRSSLTNLHSLMEQCPPPQPTLTHKQIRALSLNEDQAMHMVEQVSKMKTSMKRLQNVIRKFNYTEKLKKDIDFVIANVGPAIAKAELMKQLEKAPCILHSINKGERK